MSTSILLYLLLIAITLQLATEIELDTNLTLIPFTTTKIQGILRKDKSR